MRAAIGAYTRWIYAAVAINRQDIMRSVEATCTAAVAVVIVGAVPAPELRGNIPHRADLLTQQHTYIYNAGIIQIFAIVIIQMLVTKVAYTINLYGLLLSGL